METLEMLEPLVTLSRTRNIVERNSLVSPPFRKTQRRSELLDNLADKRIVRIEQRLGGQFVKITHEFLIESILTKIRNVLNADPLYGRFRWAIRMLERYEDIDFRGGSRHLPDARLFGDLNEKRADIEWTPWSVELMLRSAIVTGADAAVTHYWAKQYLESGLQENVASILSEDRIREQTYSLLSADELRFINLQDAQTLNTEQIEFVFRSYIKRADDAAREQVIRWTKILEKTC
jgi:hypothetical protein